MAERNIRDDRNGWVFIDAILGVAIVAVALTTITLAYTQTSKATVANTNRTQAIYLAQQELENLKVNDGAESFGPLTTKQLGPFRGTTYTVVSATFAEAGLNDTKIVPVQATVTWSDISSSKENSVKLISYYYLK